MNELATQKQNRVLRWGAWAVTFVSFIIGGVVARAVAGPAIDISSTLLGGFLAGASIGLAQWLALRYLLPGFIDARWVVATAVGLSIGLAAGSVLVDYRVGAIDLAVLGVVIGAVVGALQAWALKGRIGASWRWLLLSAPLWGASWLVTWVIGVDVSIHWAVFGASGALFNTVITGVALRILIHESRKSVSGVKQRITAEHLKTGAMN